MAENFDGSGIEVIDVSDNADDPSNFVSYTAAGVLRTIHDVTGTTDAQGNYIYEQPDFEQRTLVEGWAHEVSRSSELRGAVSADGKLLDDRHSVAGIFHMDDRVSLRDAWDAVGGHRVGVRTTTAESVFTIPDNNGERMMQRVNIDSKAWIYPTLDGEIFNPAKPLDIVSSTRYEIVNPNDVVQVMDDNFRELDGTRLNVVAIAFNASLNSVIIQFERPHIEVKGIGDIVRRFFTVHIPILGSVMAGAVDTRWACMNYLPTLLSSAMLRIRHLTGANEAVQGEFTQIVKELDFAQQIQGYAYDILSDIPLEDGDERRIIQSVFPYSGLPAGYDQSVGTDEISGWMDALQAWEAGKDKASKPAHEVPITQNRKIVQQRILAEKGIGDAISEVGPTLWALAQANYAATHHPTKSTEARVRDILIKGWRRNTATNVFREVLGIAHERGAEMPKKLASIALVASADYQDRQNRLLTSGF